MGFGGSKGLKPLTCEVAILGAGVVGLSIAYELRKAAGLDVLVLDQSRPGTEASWAGAGMLPPGHRLDHPSAEARLRALAHARWNDWAPDLMAETGLDIGYRREEALGLADAGEFASSVSHEYAGEGVQVQPISPTEVKHRLGCVVSGGDIAFEIPEFGQVRNPRYLQALLAALAQRGVPILAETAAESISASSHGVKTIARDGTVISSERVIIAAGAWTQRFLSVDATTNAPNIRPIRGQIALLREKVPTLNSIIERGKKYLVPRGDGHVLIGSTEDDIGFDRSTDQVTVEDLIEFARTLVPSLRAAVLERAWAGLRPWNGSSVPWMGWLKSHGEMQEEESHVLLMAGHFRHGLQMSPATAQLARQLILGESPAIPLPSLPDGLVLKPALPN